MTRIALRIAPLLALLSACTAADVTHARPHTARAVRADNAGWYRGTAMKRLSTAPRERSGVDE